MCERAIDQYKPPIEYNQWEFQEYQRSYPWSMSLFIPKYMRSSLKPTTVRIKTTSRPALPGHSAQTNLLPQHS